MKRPENSAHFPASHLPHPFPSKPRERRRTRSYKKPPQERSEEEAAEEEEEEGGGGEGARGGRTRCIPRTLLPLPAVGQGAQRGGGTPRRAWLCVFRVHLVARETSRDAPVAWGEGLLQDSGAS